MKYGAAATGYFLQNTLKKSYFGWLQMLMGQLIRE